MLEYFKLIFNFYVFLIYLLLIIIIIINTHYYRLRIYAYQFIIDYLTSIEDTCIQLKVEKINFQPTCPILLLLFNIRKPSSAIAL